MGKLLKVLWRTILPSAGVISILVILIGVIVSAILISTGTMTITFFGYTLGHGNDVDLDNVEVIEFVPIESSDDGTGTGYLVFKDETGRYDCVPVNKSKTYEMSPTEIKKGDVIKGYHTDDEGHVFEVLRPAKEPSKE